MLSQEIYILKNVKKRMEKNYKKKIDYNILKF